MAFSIENKQEKDPVHESVEWDMVISPGVAEHLPKITDEEMQTHLEKFCGLIGKWEIAGDRVRLLVDMVMDIDDPAIAKINPDGHEVSLDFDAYHQAFKDAQAQHPDLSEFSLVGEVHTHPYTPQELNREPHLPSQADMEGWVRQYELGWNSTKIPYIFGIASRNNDGGNTIAFYRIVREDNGAFAPAPLNDWSFSE